jgi:hypothetical protein
MKTRIAAAAVLLSLFAAAPAEARDHGPRDRKHHRHHRDKRNDAVGNVVAGAVLVGLVAALIDKKQAPPLVEEVAYVPPPRSETDPDAAIAACAAAAEGEGRRSFALAQAGVISAVDPAGDGYAVKGDLILRTGWRDAGEHRMFRCSVDSQAVRRVSIDGLVAEPVLGR